MRIRTAIGQDSHRFDLENPGNVLKLAGIEFPSHPPLVGNSDADVVLHAVTNAISGISGVNILGEVADGMCQRGITDSAAYVQAALETLRGWRIYALSVSIECKTPRITPRIPEMKANLARLLGIEIADIGLTATSGEGLTAFGRGEGIQVLVVINAHEEKS